VSFLIPTGGETLASLVTLQEKQDVPMNSIAEWELQIDTYRQTARRHRADAENKRQQRLAQGWEVARKAADLLRERFLAYRVVAFGCLIGQSISENLAVIIRDAAFSRYPIHLM
jgi:uncharacterized membrane protein YqiK